MIAPADDRQARAALAARVFSSPELRATHPSAFRCGEWGQVGERRAHADEPLTVVVAYADGVRHAWVADDVTMLYELRRSAC